MKSWLLLLIVFALSACASPAPTAQNAQSGFPDLGAAPELAGDVWLNTQAPLRLADLRGKVVLVDMWTFG